jgi:phosphatidate cytidylyltransferase
VLRARLATAAVAIPLLLLLIFAGPAWAFVVLVGAAAGLGLLEFAAMVFATQWRDRVVTVALGTLVIGGAIPGPGPWLLAALTAAFALALVWTYLGRRDFERALPDVGIMLIGLLYVGFLLPHFIWLRATARGPEWVTLVLAAAMVGDSSGYFVGHAFGRHKLAPRVSPGKSVEGALAILAGSVVASLAVCALLLPEVGWREAILLGFTLGVLEQLGDLSESVMKRTFGTKESGWVLPGHGGVLDRIDSLLFPVAFVYYYTVLLR